MESVMWAFRRLHEHGLVYEGHKVVPYCTRCQTSLSNFEARLDDAYRPKTDLSCVVKFRLVDDPGTSLLAWTTTPWTLPANAALAVNPVIDYVECVVDAERMWVAADAADRFPQLTVPQRRVKGQDLVGARYVPPFSYFASMSNAFVVLPADFVSAEEGTGVVHLAPAFGEDDEAVCREAGIAGPQPVRDDGTFAQDVRERFVEILSGWYLRVSRSKAWSSGTSAGKSSFYEVLHLSLETTARVVAPFMPFVAEALFRSLGSPHSVHLADWPAARSEWTDERLAGEMTAVRAIVGLARSIRERLGIRHRHPLPVLYAGGVDASVLTTHVDLLQQEVNVKRVEVLSEQDRDVTRTVQLKTPQLGKRLRQGLRALQTAVTAGDYVITPDGCLRAAGVVVGSDEYSYEMNVVDRGAAVAAEGGLVVVLDTTRDDRLHLEGEARDLNRVVQDLRKRARLGYSERIVLSISGRGVERLLTSFGPWLMEQALAVALTTTRLDEPLATGSVTLGSAPVRVEIGRSRAG